jgi:hypothetical protein
MPIDPDLAAILLAFAIAVLIAAAGSRRAATERRRALELCASCGRRFVQRQPSCDCSG